MYTIDTMVKHRSAKRTTKRSAKRAAKRGAYKSKRTHRKMKLSRKRMQRGGQKWWEQAAAEAAALNERALQYKADNLDPAAAVLKGRALQFKAENLDPAAAALKEKADAVAATFLASFSGIAVDVVVGLLKTVQSLKTMFQIVSTIAEISKFQAGQQQDAMKTKLRNLTAKLKESMKEYLDNNPELARCIDVLQSKGETGGVVVIDAPTTDVGNTCVFTEDRKLYYKALVVEDITTDEGDHVLYLWLNGAGYDPKQVQYDLIKSGFLKYVTENSDEFKNATDKYGQSPVTLQEARDFHKIPAPGAVTDVEMTQSSPQEEVSIFETIKDLVTKMKGSADKKKTLLDMIAGMKTAFLIKLDGLSNRFQYPDLVNCVKQIKGALLAKIGEHLETLKLSGSVDSTVSSNEITPGGIVQKVRENSRFSNFTSNFSTFGLSR